MDAKVTLSFNKKTIESAKKFAQENGLSLSRLTEFLLNRAMAKPFDNLEELPISEWVNIVSDGGVEYKTEASSPSRKKLKDEFYKSKGK